MEQSTEVEKKELPSCFPGCAIAFFIAPLCGFALCWLTYQMQATFNRVPLFHGLYDFTYLFTFPLGVFIGCVATWVFWWFEPKKVWLFALVSSVLICFLGLSILFINPITDPQDPSFGMEHNDSITGQIYIEPETFESAEDVMRKVCMSTFWAYPYFRPPTVDKPAQWLLPHCSDPGPNPVEIWNQVAWDAYINTPPN